LGIVARGSYTAPWINGTLEGRRNYQNQSTAFLNLNTGLVLGGGRASLHNVVEESGLQAHLQSVRDVPIAIQVNQRTRRTVRAGRSAFVPLQSYAIYDIGIQPSTPEDLAYSQETERFIVYPGNVIRLDRSIQPVLILVGQLVDGDGGILPAALMRTTEVLGRTDQDGYFQIDVVLGETVRVTQSNGETCRFAITEVMVSPEPYTNLGKVTCN
jgi:outer membrane usher protein FimD/PapC